MADEQGTDANSVPFEVDEPKLDYMIGLDELAKILGVQPDDKITGIALRGRKGSYSWVELVEAHIKMMLEEEELLAPRKVSRIDQVKRWLERRCRL